ncbi:MAG: dimethylarginine dimethylaminohydrolase [Glaciihabitans sp.]|nr:dimethylarginine dimethylaminohydrolase [Glaciihabitans sp.]
MTPRAPLSRRLLASVFAALASSIVTFAAILFVLLTVTSGAFATWIPYVGFFLGPALVLFVLLSAASAVGALTTLARALVSSLIAAIFGSYLGTLVFFAIAFPTTDAARNTANQAGFDVIFAIVAIIATITVGRRLYAWTLSYSAPTAPAVHRVALVRAPASTLAKGQLTHLKRKPIRVDKAEAQWEAYVAALQAEGFTTLEVEVADEFPDSVFIEDTVVILGQTAVITSPGAESRRGEPDAVAEMVRDLGLEMKHIRLPGTLDGGDVLKIDKTIYVGRGGRTNAEGIRQFRAMVGELGYTVVAVPVTKALHLKSSVTALPDGTVIGHSTLVDHPELFPRYLEVPEVAGVAVLVLSSSAVLMAASAPKSVALIENLGYRVVTVDIAEFEKLEGCVTCLSVRIR